MRRRRIRRHLPDGWSVEPGGSRLGGSAHFVLLDKQRAIRGAIARDWKRTTWRRTTWTGWVPFGSTAHPTTDLGALTTELVALAPTQTERVGGSRQAVHLGQPDGAGLGRRLSIPPWGRTRRWAAVVAACGWCFVVVGSGARTHPFGEA